MSRSLDPLNQTIDEWQSLAVENPLGSILVGHNKWEIADFFETGLKDMEWIMDQIDGQRIHFDGFESALDFGCGVGRLTQALANSFVDVVGVDSSERMIELAGQFAVEINEAADRQQVRFILNKKPDLSIFPDNTFDFVCSQIVLQHIPPPYAGLYIQEFIRVLKPKGLFAFQIPHGLRGRSVPPYTDVNHPTERIKMYAIPVPDVIDLIRDAGGALNQVTEDNRAGESWVSYYYFGVKPA